MADTPLGRRPLLSDTPRDGHWSGRTHPTGMHSSCFMSSWHFITISQEIIVVGPYSQELQRWPFCVGPEPHLRFDASIDDTDVSVMQLKLLYSFLASALAPTRESALIPFVCLCVCFFAAKQNPKFADHVLSISFKKYCLNGFKLNDLQRKLDRRRQIYRRFWTQSFLQLEAG